MQIIVSGQQLEVTSALKSYAEKKIGRLDKYFAEAITSGKVEMVHHDNKAPDKRNEARVIMNLHGAVITAREEHEDMYAAIDLLFEKVEKQLMKYKDKLKGHKGEKMGVVFSELLRDQESEWSEASRENPIVYTSKQLMKPMSVEESTLQLQISHMEFLVFTNDRTSQTNVIYKRKDGNFGLIEPEF
ncbi:MAG: ribosome-associated translation inhibitor RaiA [Candidatus Margulisiibacteriota bacterium]